MNKWFPVGIFTTFVLALLGAVVVLQPSWGLMDDFQNLRLAREVWGPPLRLDVLTDSFMGGGVFRPGYYCWVVVVYSLFQNSSVGLYVFNFIFNITGMVCWGLVFYRVFRVRREDRNWTVFFYPLTFFIFTAFWNIFNYLSLQEKFVVFFAPIAIYLFQDLYREFRWRRVIALIAVIAMGMICKATFIYIPAIFLVYALLDIVVFRYRPQLSAGLLALHAMILSGYAFFTVNVQFRGSYTQKYKSNLTLQILWERLHQVPLIMKLMLLIGVAGCLGVIIYSVLKKKPEFSLSVLIYLGLSVYVVLLLPWGSQSYLLSATGPLVLGSLFPVYDWFNRRGGMLKVLVNAAIVCILGMIFSGLILPSIDRMADTGKTMNFMKQQSEASPSDVYFMPPPYSESAFSMEKFTEKKVVFCEDGMIKGAMLSEDSNNYVLFNDLFASVHLKDVKTGDLVYANKTWRVFRLVRSHGNDEPFAIKFETNVVQRLKTKIRDMRF